MKLHNDNLWSRMTKLTGKVTTITHTTLSNLEEISKVIWRRLYGIHKIPYKLAKIAGKISFITEDYYNHQAYFERFILHEIRKEVNLPPQNREKEVQI